jgi:Domain of unknown function (DUF4258)
MHKWSKSQFEEYIKTTAKDGLRIVVTQHAKNQMRLRGIQQQAMEATLRSGNMLRECEPNIAKGTYECRMEKYVAGKDIGVVVAVSEDNPNLIIVTAMYV